MGFELWSPCFLHLNFYLVIMFHELQTVKVIVMPWIHIVWCKTAYSMQISFCICRSGELFFLSHPHFLTCQHHLFIVSSHSWVLLISCFHPPVSLVLISWLAVTFIHSYALWYCILSMLAWHFTLQLHLSVLHVCVKCETILNVYTCCWLSI